MKKLFTLLLLLIATATSALATDLYLIGNFNNWATKDANYKFTDKGNNIYTLEFNGTLDAIFKINDGSWNTSYNLGAADDATVSVDTPIKLVNRSDSKNITPTTAFVNPTLTLNLTEMTLTITGKTEDIKQEVGYAIHGQVFGVPAWHSYLMTKEDDGTYTLANENWVEGDFGIKVYDTKSEAQLDWYNADGNSAINSDALTQTFKVKKEGANWHSTLKGGYKVTFDPKLMTLKFDTYTGVADIADENAVPVYYNLQGVKMGANALVPGIYIVKQGKTTKKVVVK